MKLKNGAEYMESLRKIKPLIYYKGKRIEDVTRHPATARSGSSTREPAPPAAWRRSCPCEA